MTASELEKKFAALQPGQSLIYHVGVIAIDRKDDRVDDVAHAAQRLSEREILRKPIAFLTQSKVDDGRYSYRITKARHVCKV